jgi:hypothetical protein
MTRKATQIKTTIARIMKTVFLDLIFKRLFKLNALVDLTGIPRTRGIWDPGCRNYGSTGNKPYHSPRIRCLQTS